ncbi:NADPH-dependent FMN reductase [Streptomyces sp. NPDC050560]|uniref:NADPH-dependent FMN reductase n=1 Tax=Streptomyces sp. NPDC050560 TaxID=3365630 RepID=UPI0037AB23E4
MSDTAESQTASGAAKVAIIVGTTRPGRKAETVARWVQEIAARRDSATFDVVDIADFDLPHLDEPAPARSGQYTRPHTKAWSEKIGAYDAYVFVTPEYNGSIPGVLKTAVDFLGAEWGGKPTAYVSYGWNAGRGAAGHLRDVLSVLGVRHVEAAVELAFKDDFEEATTFRPAEQQEKNVLLLVDELLAKAAEPVSE